MTADPPPDLFATVAPVLPEWTDYNGHLNVAYYLVLFDRASDVFHEAHGFGADAVADTGKTVFAVEVHLTYGRELHAGDEVRIESRVLGLDAKRLHLFQEMVRVSDGARAATAEKMYLSVDLATRRSAPFGAETAARLQATAAAHAGPAPPPEAGRAIRMPAAGGPRS